jgi:Zn-dependent protease with chaperone function
LDFRAPVLSSGPAEAFPIMRFLFFCGSLLAVLFLQAQPAPALLKKDPSREKSLLTSLDARLASDLSTLEGKNKKELAAVFRERQQGIRERITAGEVVTDAQAEAYLQQLAAPVFRANPQLKPSELRLLFSRAWWPNASSLGEGTILFNIGLFSRLQNEAQAVFVLCHELAHYYQDHGNKAIRSYVATVNSAAFQQELKEIRNMEYRQNEQAVRLVKGLAFNSRRHSREHEFEADSLALELMKPTGYDLNEALSALALLDTIDQAYYPAPLLEKEFHFAAYPFKKSWLQSNAFQFSIQKEERGKAEEDSLKTHPDCTRRIARLSGQVARAKAARGKTFLSSEETFRRLARQFEWEMLAYSFESGRVSQCLYLALMLTRAHADQAYPPAMVGKCLNELYTRQKAHELGKVADLPGSHHPKAYNDLLQLIQNLRLNEMAALSYHFLQQHAGRFSQDAEFATAWRLSQERYRN